MSLDSIAAPGPVSLGAGVPSPAAVLPELHDPASQHLNRKRRMNYISNLLDSDGNLQNEMLAFAFAATMLSTIPILLGNEFDVNDGLRKKRQVGPYQESDDPDISSYSYYTPSPEDSKMQPLFSGYTYKTIMTSPPGTDYFHIHNGSVLTPGVNSNVIAASEQETRVTNASLGELINEVLQWSHEKVKNKPLLPMLINLALDKYSGNLNPADKLVRTAYKKWKNYG
ncbi:uncharacterized protein [Procambarus clarkii]|uniref:uncharacterized protein n=1 Tax=Procambarus clarkii TaxID=6728 RepID=UPI001E67175F|nr:uncharacterized protein LOC123768124 [Procambarus clarkii]